jgi:hypothetical protein
MPVVDREPVRFPGDFGESPADPLEESEPTSDPLDTGFGPGFGTGTGVRPTGTGFAQPRAFESFDAGVSPGSAFDTLAGAGFGSTATTAGAVSTSTSTPTEPVDLQLDLAQPTLLETTGLSTSSPGDIRPRPPNREEEEFPTSGFGFSASEDIFDTGVAEPDEAFEAFEEGGFGDNTPGGQTGDDGFADPADSVFDDLDDEGWF